MDMLERMVETARLAKATGRLCYLYWNKVDGFVVSPEFKNGEECAFRAYPGGRKELSVYGTVLFRQCVLHATRVG